MIAKSLHSTEAFYSDHFRGIIVNTLSKSIVSRWDCFTSTTLEDNEERISSCLVCVFINIVRFIYILFYK